MRRDPADGGRLAEARARRAKPARSLGFSLSRSVADEAELLLLAVLPRRHRQGVGTRLLDDFIDRARDAASHRVHLEVRDGNPAVGMYRAAGFTPVGRRRNYYHGADGDAFDALTLPANFNLAHFNADYCLACGCAAEFTERKGNRTCSLRLHGSLLFFRNSSNGR